VVVKEREEYRDSFDNRRLELLINVGPVVVIPALDRFQLFLAIFVHADWTGFPLDGRFDPKLLTNLFRRRRIRHSIPLSSLICFEASFGKFSRVTLKDFA